MRSVLVEKYLYILPRSWALSVVAACAVAMCAGSAKRKKIQ